MLPRGREEYERALNLYDRANRLLLKDDPSEVERYAAAPLDRGGPQAADGRARRAQPFLTLAACSRWSSPQNRSSPIATVGMPVTPRAPPLVADELGRQREFGPRRPSVSPLWRAGSLADLDNVLAAATDAGLDPDEVAAGIQREDIKERLKANTAEALERGVTGIPTVAIGDELFWGDDHLTTRPPPREHAGRRLSRRRARPPAACGPPRSTGAPRIAPPRSGRASGAAGSPGRTGPARAGTPRGRGGSRSACPRRGRATGGPRPARRARRGRRPRRSARGHAPRRGGAGAP